MINAFNEVLNFLLMLGKGEHAPYISMSVFLACILIFIVELVVAIVKAPKKIYFYNLCFSVALIIVGSYFAISDLLYTKLVFFSAERVYVYCSVCLLVCLLFYICLYGVYSARCKNAEEKPIKKQEELPASRATAYFSGRVEDLELNANSWLDINYLKGLISNLKSKDIPTSDLIELEDFEVYLLNFVTREPNAYERKVLSEKINLLIKKIALYDAG